MARSKSSRQWLQEHFNDPFVKAAKAQGYRSRATYKLIALQEKDHFTHPGDTILDLGAAPGGWSQIAVKWAGKKGRVIASDILEMQPLDGVIFIEGDFRDESVIAEIRQAFGATAKADVVLSDMAPNMSGVASVDQARGMHLAELALEMAQELLKPSGSFAVKVFQGEGFDEYLRSVRAVFKSVAIRKPEASRGRSAEVYLVAKEKK